MDIHEAANLFPLAESSIVDLADDIRKHGQLVPVEIYGGKILDGRRRWKACELAGVPAKTVEVNPDDPVAYVLSLNLHRRQLTPSQLAMVAARARAIYDRQARDRHEQLSGRPTDEKPMANLPQDTGSARDAAGKAVGVSGKSVDHATKVLRLGVPELVVAVDSGRMAVSTAAVLAHETEDVQMEAAAKARRTYTKETGGGKKQEPKRHVVVDGEVYDGMRYANMAIEQLKRIKNEDPSRGGALDRVETWINRNR